MWSLKNETPYSAERGWYRDVNGAEVWVVAMKATYDIRADGSTQLSSPLPVNSSIVISPDSDEILYETDLGPEKNSTDILLNGHAWAPNNLPVNRLFIGLKVSGLCRLARVRGPRIWNGDSYDSPSKFLSIPLRYPYMAQGSFSDESICNPLGITFDENPEKGRSRLPQIEFLSDSGYPGFGTVPRQWPGRVCHAGTYDKHWQETQSPLLPEDFDPRFWQVAPPPQYAAGQLQGNETVTLANLTPPSFSPSNILSFAIPKISFNLRTQFTDGSVSIHRAKIHTVIIEPDHPRLSVVWHTALPCHRKANMLDFTTITEKKRLNHHPLVLPTQFKEWEQLS
ncbi:DUF2169 family type VI secretion system accessory protein [Rahnella woolbedingensis]|uniref:DUF2169 domain-containing protein n=1 Tax=Rahnella woolbedingensis TaxID=1510574 RepID=A0A419N814_9GAMM|nr:DUF2169 domain-containing protein [Rahnella woolbedingensis]RJT43516.1 DUF2169 domain-containing protein [Rahnella woolbedingensis]